MTQRDYYEVLELTKTATHEEIKKSYRKLAMKYHPDRNGGDKQAEIQFKEVNQAYSVLSDSAKRQQYDTFGHTGGSGFSGASDFGMGDISDIFNSFFGGGFSQSRARPTSFVGEDIEIQIRVNLETSLYGATQTMDIPKRTTCESCNGVGGEGKTTCETCAGNGQVTYTSRTPFGTIQQTRVCPECEGTGEGFTKTCPDCSGNKRVLKTTPIEIDIPAGIGDGMIIKLSEEGHAGIGGERAGDLYVRFQVQNSYEGLTREGIDLHYSVDIDVVEATLGVTRDISLPILGKRTIDIPAGTQYGSQIKLSGDGVKNVQSDDKGDLYLHIHITIPKKLSKRQKELYSELAEEKNIAVPKKKSIFKKHSIKK